MDDRERFADYHAKKLQRQIRETQRDLARMDNLIEATKVQLQSAVERKQSLEAKLESIQTENKRKDLAMIGRYIWDGIKALDPVEHLDFEQEYAASFLTVTTKEMQFFDGGTNMMRELGAMSIRIRCGRGSYGITIKNLTRTVDGYSCGMHHPHVYHHGQPCWGGEFDRRLYQILREEDYILAFNMILSWLQTCNPDDPAGAEAYKWPEASENTVSERLRSVYGKKEEGSEEDTVLIETPNGVERVPLSSIRS